MDVRIRKADLKTEIRGIMRMDRLIFPVDAYETSEKWENHKCYWVIVKRRKVGMIAFVHDEDHDKGGGHIHTLGNLYIPSTGIIPDYQGMGLGNIAKAYEVAYALQHGFSSISVTCRKSNEPILKLNKAFGFRRTYVIPHYYGNEDGIRLVREL